jgi:multicomponent Na+:H+ antiporter subunit E
MSETGAPIRLFASLLLFWLLLNNSLALDAVAIGVLVAGLLAYFLAANLSYLSGYRFTPASFLATLRFTGFFLKELVKANLSMALIVLQPVLPIDPAIVRVRTSLKNPTARLLLANAITLTPGTLSVEVKGEWLYIHWVVAETADAEAATKAIAAGFERYLEVMYG